MSLVNEGQLFAVDPAKTYAAQRHAIDDALELAASLNTGALAPGISGSWAALEALFTDAQDSDQAEGKVAAAARAARLTASSWPRAELTALFYQVDGRNKTGKELASRLQAAETNRDRSEIVAEQLRRDHGLPLRRSWRFQSDVAAVTRMNHLLADPANALKQVSGYVEASLRRLMACEFAAIAAAKRPVRQSVTFVDSSDASQHRASVRIKEVLTSKAGRKVAKIGGW